MDSRDQEKNKRSRKFTSRRETTVLKHLEILKNNPLSTWRDGQAVVKKADKSVRQRQIESLMVPYEFARLASTNTYLMQDFLMDEFWVREGGHKPKAEDILQRSIEFHFGCSRKKGALYDRCWTYARALKSFFERNVDVMCLPDEIKTAHGLERLCRDRIAAQVSDGKEKEGKTSPVVPAVEKNGAIKGKKGPAMELNDTISSPQSGKAKASTTHNPKKSEGQASKREFDMNTVIVIEDAREGIEELMRNKTSDGAMIQARITNIEDNWVTLRYEYLTMFPEDGIDNF